MRSGKLLIAGSSNTDLVILSTQLPAPGETVTGGEFFQAMGGKGANQAVAAARAGADVTFLSCVGSDDYGNAALEAFTREGINTDFIRIDKEAASGIALIMVDGRGENIISVAPGANFSLNTEDVDKAETAFESAACLLTQLEIPVDVVERAFEAARKRDMITILNPAPVPKQSIPDSLLEKTDIFIPNQIEAQAILGSNITDLNEIAARLTEKGPTDIIFTLGSKGALWITESGTATEIPPVRAEPVDTVGAGDCFCGVLAAGLCQGKEMEETLQFATAAAAISVTRKGAQPSMPRKEEINL